MTMSGFSIGAGRRRNSLAISHELATLFPLEITPVLKEYSCADTAKKAKI